MKNSIAILTHLKAHKSKDPIYERTTRGIMAALGMSRSVVTNCLYHMKAHGLIAANPSKMLVGKRPNLPTRGAWHANSYDITKKGLEYLEVRI